MLMRVYYVTENCVRFWFVICSVHVKGYLDKHDLGIAGLFFKH